MMGGKKARRVKEVVVKDEGDEDEDEESEAEDENGAGPGPSSAKSRRKQVKVSGADGEGDDDEDEDEDMEGDAAEDEDDEQAQVDDEPTSTQPSPFPTGPVSDKPPRILLTTSPHATQATHAFMGELRSVLPGGEVYKRLKGRGFEVGRIARWAAKREFKAMVIVNEDHKAPNAITVINLPAGPTAYFKLTSVVLGQQIGGHARASPHSPELILNNFSTLLGMNIGRLFGSLFPPMPQFRGRQVVTLHNQRDFLFFRRHR
jgi:ribosome production factor 1